MVPDRKGQKVFPDQPSVGMRGEGGGRGGEHSKDEREGGGEGVMKSHRSVTKRTRV